MELNAGISPSNNIEETLQTTNSIYFNNLDEDGIFILTDEDEETLREIAEYDVFFYGQGVLDAWAMLDTMIHTYLEFEEKEAGILANIEFTVYPNPTGDYFYICNNTGDDITMEVKIYSSDGKNQLSFSNVHLLQPLDISMLHSGIYEVAVLIGDQMKIMRMITLKPDKK